LANLGSVILFAVAGTLFNVFVIGYGLYGVASFGWMGTFRKQLVRIQLSELIAVMFRDQGRVTGLFVYSLLFH